MTDPKPLPGWRRIHDGKYTNGVFTVKKCLTVDDFVPKGSAGDIARQHKEADRLIRAAGNLQGRETLTATRQLRGSYYPRSLILSTGEDIPKGASCRARMVVCETEPSDMNWSLLTECQAEAAAGLYAQTMAAFIEWVAPRLDRMPARILEQLTTFREQWANRQHHSRTPDNLGNLSCGLDVFLEFAQEVKALTARQAAQLWERALVAYDEAAHAQDRTQAHGEPVKQYLDLLQTALSSGQAHMVRRDGSRPDHESRWGWMRINGDWRPQGRKIGWIDEDLLLLDPKASFAVVQNIGREIGDPIPLTLQTLGRRLKQRGVLRECDEGRETTKTRRSVEDGARVSVWVADVNESLCQSALSQIGEDDAVVERCFGEPSPLPLLHAARLERDAWTTLKTHFSQPTADRSRRTLRAIQHVLAIEQEILTSPLSHRFERKLDEIRHNELEAGR